MTPPQPFRLGLPLVTSRGDGVTRPPVLFCPALNFDQELTDSGSHCSWWANEEANMPVLLLWAVPAVIVVGGVGYYLIRVVH